MDGTPNNPAAKPKARRLRKVTLLRGRHSWTFTCEAGAEAQLVRFAVEVLERERVPMRALHGAVLARRLGVAPEALKAGVRKAD